jgi:carbonyl reductase 1
MKKILVTGGNKGIGFAVCQALLEQYPDVHVLLGSRDTARGQQAVEQLKQAVGVDKCQGRLEVITINTTDPASVTAAAASITAMASTLSQPVLHGLVNNAGYGLTQPDTMETNYWGTRRVTDTFLPLLETASGGGARIVNIGSAAGPMYVRDLPDDDKHGTQAQLKTRLAKPWTIPDMAALDELARTTVIADASDTSWEAYGLSKALVSAYTYLLSTQYPNMYINSVTPGFIDTDLTAGMGAKNTPAQGAVPILYCLASAEITTKPQGRYYGSDCQRSPLGVYRGPGEDEYQGPDGP